MKYRSFEKIVNGVTFVFVTRGRSKEFSQEEADEYLRTRVDSKLEMPKTTFLINNSLRTVFLNDMNQFGIKFCQNKYGGSEQQIISEAKRFAPYSNYKRK